MEWKDVAGTIARAAPKLGALLAVPTGGASVAVGGIISLVGSMLGLTPAETTPDRVSQIIEQDPQALVKFKELEFRHGEAIEAILLEHEKLRYQDIAGARQREVKIVEATGKKDTNLYVLAWTVIIGFFTLTALLMFVNITESQAVLLLFGSLAAGFGMVLQYFFGSSKSSSDKTQIIAAKGMVPPM